MVGEVVAGKRPVSGVGDTRSLAILCRDSLLIEYMGIGEYMAYKQAYGRRRINQFPRLNKFESSGPGSSVPGRRWFAILDGRGRLCKSTDGDGNKTVGVVWQANFSSGRETSCGYKESRC